MKVFHYERFLAASGSGLSVPGAFFAGTGSLRGGFWRGNGKAPGGSSVQGEFFVLYGTTRRKKTAPAEKALTFLQYYSNPPHVMTVC